MAKVNQTSNSWVTESCDSDSKAPRTVTLPISGTKARLSVTRLHGLDGWYMHLFGVNINFRGLESRSLKRAKKEATTKVRELCRAILDALEAAELDFDEVCDRCKEEYEKNR